MAVPPGRPGAFTAHHTVNHSEDQYVDYSTGATTDQVENFFGQLKRSLDGTYHHVSREHLNRYLSEFEFRYSTRKVSDASGWGGWSARPRVGALATSG